MFGQQCISKFCNCFVVSLVLLLTACAGVSTVNMDDAGKRSIRSVSIKPEVPMPPDMFYQGRAQSIGMGIGGLIGGAIASAGTSDKQLMLQTMEKNKISVGELITTEFANELRRSGKLPFAEASVLANAEFKFEVVMYGLGQTQGFSAMLYPTLGVNATLAGKDGKVLWQRYEFITPLNKDNTVGASADGYFNDPELLRSAFKKAASVLSRIFIETL